MNNDGEMNIADINALIDIILGSMTVMQAEVNCVDLLHMNDVTMKPGDVRTINVTVEHADRYSALQCDIVLPTGLTLVDMNVPNGNESKMQSVNDATSRAMTYSMDKRPFMSDSQNVMSFNVRADELLTAESQITLRNIVLADADNKAWHLTDAVARVNNCSGVNDLHVGSDRVWVENNVMCIEVRQDSVARIVSIDGVVHDLSLKAGVTRHKLDPGIYVVVLNGQSLKIAVK